MKVTQGKGSPRSRVVVVVRSGPRSGRADMEAAFETRQAAVGFLANLHGLTTEESKRLAREGALTLDRRWHGSETCSLREVPMSPQRARQALSGELFEAA